MCSERCSFFPQDSSCRETEVRTTHIKLASFPGSPGTRVCIMGRAWYLFPRKHDVIKIGTKTERQRFACCSITARCVRYLTLATFALFPILSRRYAYAQLSRVYLLSIFNASHVRKNTRLSTPAQLQCSRFGAWEPGNEATLNHKHTHQCSQVQG